MDQLRLETLKVPVMISILHSYVILNFIVRCFWMQAMESWNDILVNILFEAACRLSTKIIRPLMPSRSERKTCAINKPIHPRPDTWLIIVCICLLQRLNLHPVRSSASLTSPRE